MVFSNLIAVYLFLGGTAAGCFTLMAGMDVVEYLYGVRRYGTFSAAFRVHVHRPDFITRRRIARLVYVIACIGLLFGLGCLLGDLGQPLMFWKLFLFPTTSLVSLGSFGLSGLFICMILVLMNAILTLPPVFRNIAIGARFVGIPFGIFVMVYTGLLLKAVLAVQLWQSAWLPALFLFSALSCACGAILLCVYFCSGYRGVKQWVHAISVIDIVFIVLEIVAVVGYLCSLYAAQHDGCMASLLFENTPLLFWGGFVGCGLVLPLVIEIALLVLHKHEITGLVSFLACLILVGGLSLRFALILAGVHVAS